MPIKVGSAYLIPSGGPEQLHLCCIVAVFDPSQVLFATISTVKEGRHCDRSCILNGKADHSWLTHESYVVCRKIEQRSKGQVQKQIDAGIFIPQDDFAPEVVARIIEGIKNSDETKPFVLEILK